MRPEDQKKIAIDRIKETIDELRDEYNFEQAAVTVGRIKGFLELSFAIGLLSMEENGALWESFAAVREEAGKRFSEPT